MGIFLANWDAPSRCTATDCLVHVEDAKYDLLQDCRQHVADVSYLMYGCEFNLWTEINFTHMYLGWECYTPILIK